MQLKRMLQTGTAFLGALWALAFCLPAAAGAATAQVALANTFYSPATVTVYAGDSVQWTNTQGFHNAEADGGLFRCANGCDGQGGNGNAAFSPWVATFAFTAPARVPYHCEIHGVGGGTMKGTVIVQRSIFDDGFESGFEDEWAAPGTPGDTCASAILLTPPVVGLAGHLHGTQNDLDLTLDPSCLTASAKGRDRIYQIVVPAGLTLTATINPTSPGFDPAIYLIAALGCGAQPLACLDGADDGSPGAGETVSYLNTTGSSVTILVVVDSAAAATAGSDYTVDASIL